MLECRFTRNANRSRAYGVDGDVPETGAGGRDSGREFVKGATVVRMSAAVFETAKMRIAHQANIARVGTLDDNDVIFI